LTLSPGAQPFLLDDVAALRARILALKPEDGRRFELWTTLRDSARRAPHDFGWFVPFVATITRDSGDIARAREIVDAYLAKLDPISFSTGLQFHFWCFAFPHAKVALYFQWLCSIGAYTAAEAEEISQRLIEYHFVNFYYGMRDKPEPECVDNQALALVLSNTIVGHLFSAGENPSQMAQIMLRDGLRRLPQMLAGLPKSGYTGEGSDYMNCVVAPAVALAVEVLERVGGHKDALTIPLEPGGSEPSAVIRMMARCFMPGGLLLPWDNYGFEFGMRSSIAFGARRLGDDAFFQILESEVIWTYDIGIGWAYDDLVWTLIWWPTDEPQSIDPNWRDWFEPEIGAAFASTDGNCYVMQMWDESEPVYPTRAHVNPNAVLFSGFRVPISADGAPPEGLPHRFQFEDTWREVSFLAMGEKTRYNFGDGCAGAHSVVLLDGNEGMRARQRYEQLANSNQLGATAVSAEVTPIYRESFPDVLEVTRQTQLHEDRFITIIDRVRASKKHKRTSRFVFRPEVSAMKGGVRVRTPEGVTLQLVDVTGSAAVTIEPAANVPAKPDRASVLVDFSSTGESAHRILLALVSRELETDEQITGVAVIPDSTPGLDFDAARAQLLASKVEVPMQLPAYLEADLPAQQDWWYRALIPKRPGPGWLRLPLGMHSPQLYLNAQPIDLSPFEFSRELIAPRLAIPAALEDALEIELVLRLTVPKGHHDGKGWGTIGMTGGLGLGYPVAEERILSTNLDGQKLSVVTSQRTVELELSLEAQ